MSMKKEDLLLYAVTDRTWLNGRSLAADVEAALQGGVTFLQIREKELAEAAFLAEAKELQALAARYGVPFVVNDNVEIALAIGADGVHVGQSDMEAGDVRAKLGADKIIGVSVRTVEQALRAQAHGADYLGVGAVFGTSTKVDANTVTVDDLREICDAVSIPVVAIGGVNAENVSQLANTGIDGVAVVSALFAAQDIRAAAADLLEKTKQIVG